MHPQDAADQPGDRRRAPAADRFAGPGSPPARDVVPSETYGEREGRREPSAPRAVAAVAQRGRGPIGRGPGLPIVPAGLLAVAVSAIGGVIDLVRGDGLGLPFALSFVVGCALAALLVRRGDLLAIAFMPPLVYVFAALVVAVVSPLDKTIDAVVFGFPVLAAGTVTAIVIALVRARRAHQNSARARAG